MDEINELLNAVVNCVEEKEEPFKFDTSAVDIAGEDAEKKYEQVLQELKKSLDDITFQKILKLLKEFRIAELNYCREEHVLYYKEGFADGIKLIVTSIT